MWIFYSEKYKDSCVLLHEEQSTQWRRISGYIIKFSWPLPGNLNDCLLRTSYFVFIFASTFCCVILVRYDMIIASKIAHISLIMVNKRHYGYYNYYYWFINLFFYKLVYLLLKEIMSGAMRSHGASRMTMWWAKNF